MEASALPVDTGILRAPSSAPVLLRLRSDEQLVALFRAGNEEAFSVICDRFQTRLLAYVRRMLPAGPRANAEDVLQDVYMRAYSALRADDRPVAIRAWLYRVAHNRCIDELRRPGAQPAEIFEQEGDARLDPALAAERRESLRRLVTDLGRLPEQQRSALLMRELEGFTYEELGSTLGVTQPAVKSLLVRARVGLAEAAQARDTSCDDIREDLAETRDRRVRTSARAKRHLRDCGECRSFDKALRSTSRDLGLLLPGPAGLFAMLAGLLGGGAGAGGGAAGVAGGSGAGIAGGGIAAATATKVAVVVCCVAATAGGAAAVKVEHARKHPSPVTASSSSTRAASSRPAAPVQTLPAAVPAVTVSDPVATPEQPATADGTTTTPADGTTDPATSGETTGGLPGAGGSASPDEAAETSAADDAAAGTTTTQTVPASGPPVTTTTTPSTTAAPASAPVTTTPATSATTATVAPAS